MLTRPRPRPSQVKAAILQALTVIIAKGGAGLKPFLPQLQTTFLKSLHDGARTVRMRAAEALGLLMQLQARLDPVCNDLLSGIQAADTDAAVREALTVALCDVVKKAGANIPPPTLQRIISVLQQVRRCIGSSWPAIGLVLRADARPLASAGCAGAG